MATAPADCTVATAPKMAELDLFDRVYPFNKATNWMKNWSVETWGLFLFSDL
jgi:hypothetical protein